MRFNTQEINGSRVRLHYSVDLEYEAHGQAEFLLNVHAARTSRQQVLKEYFSVTPERPVALAEDASTGNRIASFDSGPGLINVRYSVLVEIAHRYFEPEALVADSPGALPIATLQFLYSSRYCQVDLIQQQAWDRFGHFPRGYLQVRAIRDWVHHNVQFRTGTSHPGTSVVDTLRDGTGVCRDFAHTMIAFCRALNYPARFVTGVDYGAHESLGPPDFHAYVEVYVGGSWFLFDPSGISPVTGLIRIGTGRDAADVSFATIFGPVRTGIPRVEYGAVEDAVGGIGLPAVTDLAVSTGD